METKINLLICWEERVLVVLVELLVVLVESQTSHSGGLRLRLHVGGQVLVEKSKRSQWTGGSGTADVVRATRGSWDRRDGRDLPRCLESQNIRPEEFGERSEPDPGLTCPPLIKRVGVVVGF